MKNNQNDFLVNNINKRNFYEFHTFLTYIFMALLAVCIGILPFFMVRTKSADEIFEKSINSIVEVRAYSEDVGESLGTAEFIDKNGTLVTNAHVVTYSVLGETIAFDKIFIRFATDEDYIEVELIKYDTSIDIAILKMSKSAHKFKPLKIGDSTKLKTGHKVYAIGNSAGYGLSMSEGIIGMSLVNIEYSGITRSVIQASLNITDGNSGGAILNEKGELVGITSFRTRDLKGNVIYGISYSVPIATVMEYIKN